MSELLIGMLSYSYIEDVRSDLAQNLFESFQTFYHVDSEFTQSVDLIQSKVSLHRINFISLPNHTSPQFFFFEWQFSDQN